MKRILKVIAFCSLVVFSASCAKSRAEQMELAQDVQVSSSYEVLALVGDKVPADVIVTYPAKYFSPQAIIEVTPVLVYEGGEQAAKTYTYQGDKVKDNFPVISYKDGGTVKQSFAFDYVDGMEKSYLELRSVAYYNGKPIEIPAIKVLDGCQVVQLFVDNKGELSYKTDNYKDVIRETTEGQVMYDKNSAVVKNSELRSESIQELQAALEEIASDSRYTVVGTKVVAYASPEGGQDLNAKLSDKRAQSAYDVWGKVTNGMKADDVQIQSMGQDWEGFQEAISNSNIEDKELILRVLSMYSDPAVRESEIRNMSQVYTEINENVFPELRRARFIAEIDYKNFTDEELEELSRKAIDVLDEEALLRVASKSGDAARKAELYKLAVSKFRSDRANFNLAVLSLKSAKPEEAAKYLAAVKTSDADLANAKGVVELQKGNYAEAAKFFKEAATEEAQANLGTVALLQGNYAEGAKLLANSGNHNEPVAYILAGNYDAAAKAITCDCARSNYLRAVIAARQGKADDVKKYLDKLAELSPAMKAKADKDIEFANYR